MMEKNGECATRLSREGLDRALKELADVSVEREALERLHQRLVATKEGLAALDSLIDPELEPFTILVLEDGSSESR